MLRLFLILFLLSSSLISKNLKVLFPENLYPFSSKKGDNSIGFSIDLINKIFENSEYKLQFESVISVDKGVEIVNKGGADLLSTIIISDNRSKKIDYSDVYSHIKFHLAKRSRDKDFLSLNDIDSDEVVGVQYGSYSLQYLKNLDYNFKLEPILDIDSAIVSLGNRRLKAVFGELHVLDNSISRTGLRDKVNLISESVFCKSIRIGIQKNREELYTFINRRLEFLKNDGCIEFLEKKWLNINDEEKSSFFSFFDLLTFITIVVVLVLMHKILKKNINRRNDINLFKLISQVLPICIIEIDRNYNILNEFSPSESFYKSSKESISLTGKNIKDIFGSDLFNKIFKVIKFLDTRKLHEQSFEFFVEENIFTEFSISTKNHKSYFILIRDITQHHITEMEFKEDRDKYKSMINNISASVFRIETKGTKSRYLFLSDNIESITGYNKEYFISNSFSAYKSIILPEDQGDEFFIFDTNVKENLFEYRVRTKKGKVKWIQEHIKLVKDDGEILIFDGVYLDITERKRIESDLKQSKSIYRTIIENSTEGIIVLERGNILYVNSVFRNITGYNNERDEDIVLSKIISKKDIEHLNEILLRLTFKPMNVKNLVVNMIHKNGNTLWAELNITPIKWKDKNSVMIFVTDQTQKRKNEKAIIRIREHQSYILNTISQGLISVDNKGRITHTNLVVDKLFNLDSNKVRGNLYFDIIPSLEVFHKYFFEVIR